MPTLSFFNTLSQKLEPFKPLKNGQASMYSCGPTVYDFVTIGNLRSYVFADIVKRALLAHGHAVNHTINITDFGHLVGDGDEGEDKMMTALRREGKPISMAAMKEIADIHTKAFEEDMRAIGNLPPSQYTRASEYIEEEIALVKVLDEKGYTYETKDGVYFDISRFPAYGALGHIDLEKLKGGARVEINPEKKHPADFAVWKKGDLGWESPWGKGFPGWHIECTAMAFATLGKQIDIHTGGEDHISTHHNGEIAQAEAATGRVPYVRYWMHNAFITIDGTKISKSLGNTIRLSQLIDRGYHPLDYRYWFLTGHYRTPMNFTFEALDGAKRARYRLRRFVLEELSDRASGPIDAAYQERMLGALSDDLDTPKAIAEIWNLTKDNGVSEESKRATLEWIDGILALGIFAETGEEANVKSLEVTVESLPEDVRELIEKREAARKEKKWDEADALRQAINLRGYLVEDGPRGAKITKAG